MFENWKSYPTQARNLRDMIEVYDLSVTLKVVKTTFHNKFKSKWKKNK